MEFEQLDELLLEWESGMLDDDGLERLHAMLKTDAAVRTRFVQMQMLGAAMRLEADAGLGLSSEGLQTTTSTSRESDRSRRWTAAATGWIALAACLLLCALTWLVASLVMRGAQPGSEQAGDSSADARHDVDEPTSHGVALVTRLIDVTWSDERSVVGVGQALPPGRFAIQSGHAQIEFLCGATVVVEGPAQLDLKSATLARVHHGRLRAHVPPAARGFSLEVDGLKVVDLGTEFGLSVSDTGADVQVFDGEVEVHGLADSPKLLKAGQAVVRTEVGEYRDETATPNRFLGIDALEMRASAQRAARYERWKAWSAEFRRDPRLIAYYAFDQVGDGQRRLVSSVKPTDHELDGAIVGARVVDGRWPAKRALEYKQPADRVRVQIPGEFKSLTLICWVRIDSLDRWFNSLFLTDSYDKGEPHWQILDTGQIYFSVRPIERSQKGIRDYKALTPSFWKPSLSGKWIHLAVTCNLDTNTIVHYVNGSELSRHVVPDTQMPDTTRIGAASIGNWALPTLPDARFAIRNLNGSMDEFAILRAALSSEEVKEIYEHGKP